MFNQGLRALPVSHLFADNFVRPDLLERLFEARAVQ
jgi:hypothetical protein